MENEEHVPKSIQKELNNRMDQVEAKIKHVQRLAKALVVALGININVDGDKIGYAVNPDERNQGVLAGIIREIASIRADMNGEPRIIRPN